jgi:rare lipoprotein A
MNKQSLSQVKATILTTILSAAGLLTLSTQQLKALESSSELNSSSSASSPKIARSSTNPIQEFSTTRIYEHLFNNQNAATLYFHQLPLLTFIQNPQDQEEPTTRAKAIALKLDEFYHNQIDPNKITVSWDKETKSYSIKFDQEELVKINKYTIIPDTTKKLDLDALQATNRLRRFFGGAAPLDKIAGKPKSPQPKTLTRNKNYSRAYRGMASWYGPGFHGRRTANGERFNQYALTAAHRSLPFGTKVRVTNKRNGRSVIVRINDRGPFAHGRIIDLSKGAANAIGLIQSGVAPVTVEVIR